MLYIVEDFDGLCLLLLGGSFHCRMCMYICIHNRRKGQAPLYKYVYILVQRYPELILYLFATSGTKSGRTYMKAQQRTDTKTRIEASFKR